MDITETKILVACLFGVIRFFSGILPIKIFQFLKLWEQEEEGAKFISEKRHSQINCYLAVAQSFGGGVLFATCFLHMIPEVYKCVEVLKEYGTSIAEYPYSQLIVCVGFFLVYFVEEASHWLVSKVPLETCIKRSAIIKVLPENNVDSGLSTPGMIRSGYSRSSQEKIIANNDSISLDDELNAEARRQDEINLAINGEIEAKEIEYIIKRVVKSKQQILRCIFAVLALSLHAVFEGLAIGLQDSTTNIWYLFTAVSIHSAIIMFCMGLELQIAKATTKVILIQVLILAFMNSVGVLVGLVITLASDMHTKAKSLAILLLEGLSAGTILYITFFEVLNREKERRIYRMRRALFILTGFGMMAVLEGAKLF